MYNSTKNFTDARSSMLEKVAIYRSLKYDPRVRKLLNPQGFRYNKEGLYFRVKNPAHDQATLLRYRYALGDKAPDWLRNNAYGAYDERLRLEDDIVKMFNPARKYKYPTAINSLDAHDEMFDPQIQLRLPFVPKNLDELDEYSNAWRNAYRRYKGNIYNWTDASIDDSTPFKDSPAFRSATYGAEMRGALGDKRVLNIPKSYADRLAANRPEPDTYKMLGLGRYSPEATSARMSRELDQNAEERMSDINSLLQRTNENINWANKSSKKWWQF